MREVHGTRQKDRAIRKDSGVACELAAFYTVAALFDFIYAGVRPLYAALARESFR